MVLGFPFRLFKALSQSRMDSTPHKIRKQLDCLTDYLSPLLPLANCHMVEFFTDHHWGNLVPSQLRNYLENLALNEAVEQFWTAATDWKSKDPNTELAKFVSAARSHCISVDNEICLSVDEFKNRIVKWGGEIQPEVRVKEFMSSKKAYEVQTMSSLAASLHSGGCSLAVDAGGGRGALPAVLALAHGVRGLTVDCDAVALAGGVKRDRLIQKQWHAIAKRVHDNAEVSKDTVKERASLHRYAEAYVTKDTDLTALVKKSFPEHAGQDIKILLTGLHTCGDLGPTSLRLFALRRAEALFNVPCCYHLLTEPTDGAVWSIFDKGCCDGEMDSGFPMSEHLRGYQLGRNARMLAAQSIDRVAALRQMPARSLYYRALLQVIIKKHLPSSTVAEGKLKRISSKSQSFTEYFKSADAILNLQLYDSLSDSYLTAVIGDYERRWKDLVLFYLLRMCLAQVVESVILLDRLLFLYENGFENVFLVKLFDPVLSPRCHGIVAVR
ncbi:unnamed protein product [Plutella xylostella]|uniref:(diamondback moth) hypothetical protein n=1 Tax=Plutella xylostella TaxID=51655 RepID=A0A8S4F514_PLUXY|nr:unnamed protein product [Plutella xylostella]